MLVNILHLYTYTPIVGCNIIVFLQILTVAYMVNIFFWLLRKDDRPSFQANSTSQGTKRAPLPNKNNPLLVKLFPSS